MLPYHSSCLRPDVSGGRCITWLPGCRCRRAGPWAHLSRWRGLQQTGRRPTRFAHSGEEWYSRVIAILVAGSERTEDVQHRCQLREVASGRFWAAQLSGYGAASSGGVWPGGQREVAERRRQKGRRRCPPAAHDHRGWSPVGTSKATAAEAQTGAGWAVLM